MRKSLFAFLVLAAPLASSAVAQGTPCIFSGIATEDVGTAVGSCHENRLTAELDAAECQVSFVLEQGPLICGNNFLTQHWLLFGPELPVPLALGDPFLGGSNLYVLPTGLIGPLEGSASGIDLPQNPALIGTTVNVQAVSQFVFTLSFPPAISFGTSQEVRITFQ